MSFRTTFFLATVLSAATSALAQTTPTKWVPLQMDPPKGILAAASTGAKTPTDVLHISVNLPYRDPVGMQQFVESLSDPASPNYRQFISPAQVGQRFGYSTANIEAITKYLTSQGMTVRLVSQNHLSILADATVAQAQLAFNTNIEQFVPISLDGSPKAARFSYTTSPSVPAAIRGYVSYIGGLDSFVEANHNSGPLTPAMLRTLYASSTMYSNGMQGQNRTVAISNYDGYRLSNVALEYSEFTLPKPSSGVGSNITVVPIDGANGNTYGYVAGEGDVDMQCVLAIAPLCQLMIYDDASDDPKASEFDPVSLLTKEVDDNLADVISESWGFGADSAFYTACHNLHLSMSAQGITYLAASGDHGTTQLATTPYPDMDPEVLIVGGTSVEVNGAGVRTSEIGWSGSTGGWVVSTDSFNRLPSWQKGNGVPTNIPYRLLPDVAFDSDPNTGYEIYYNGTLTQIGGTSCATPTCAAGLAVSEQQLIATGELPANSAGKQRFGRIANLLYSYNGNPSVFFDITAGSNGTLPNGTTSSAKTGWDTVTGWGPMIFSGFVAQFAKQPTLSSITVSPTTVAGGVASIGTVKLSSAAIGSGATVDLASSSTAAVLPSLVTVGAGATSATFTITTAPVAASTTATITATLGTKAVIAKLVVTPTTILNITVSPVSVVGGSSASVSGSVGLSGPAPAAGLTVTLTSSDKAAAAVPASVKVASGATTASFNVTTFSVTGAAKVTIKGTTGSVSKSVTLAVEPILVSSLTISPTTVVGGTSAGGTVTLSVVLGASKSVILTSSTTKAAVPKTVSIPAGATSATFVVSTVAVGANVTATVTARLGSSSKTAKLAITAPTLLSLTLTPASVQGSSKTVVAGTVTISSPAPVGGLAISLSSSKSSAAKTSSSVRVPAGATSVTFSVTHSKVTVNTIVTISAKQGSATKTAAMSVTP